MIDINNYYDDKGTYIFRKKEFVQKQIVSEYKNAEEAKDALVNGIQDVLKRRYELEFNYVTDFYKNSITRAALKLPETEREKALKLLPLEIVDDVRKRIQEKPIYDYCIETDDVGDLKQLIHSVIGDLSSDEITAILDEQILYDLDFKEELKDAIFLFEDIVYLSDRAIQKILREIDTLELASALQNTDDEVLQKILRSMSDRAGKMLIEDMQSIDGSQNKRTIAWNRGRIISVIFHLADCGEIAMPWNKQDTFV